MTHADRTMRRLAYAVAGLCVVGDLASIVFHLLAGRPANSFGALLALVFPAVGLIILRAHPRHGVGWVFVGTGLLNAINGVGEAAGHYAVVHRWPETVAHILLASTITWFPGLFGIITIGLLRFPTGHLLSRRWRWAEFAALACMAIWLIGALMVTPLVNAAALDNDAPPQVSGWMNVVFDIAKSMIAFIVPGVIASVASLVVRWRRSDPVQRTQIRWVAAAGVVAVIAEVAVDLLPEFGVPVGGAAQAIVESVGFSLVAIATGVAIMRYKLYEIDRIVSRGVSYAAVTVLLGATYVGIVTLGTTVMPDRYGSVGVAVATLAVAALFVPVRRWIQKRVDRRFDRARYDATRIVDRFALAIRADLDQATLSGELLQTVQRTVAPAAASVWLVPRAEL